VGDPYKDTSGPAINPIIKVVNIVAILIILIFFAPKDKPLTLGKHEKAPVVQIQMISPR